MLKKLSLTNLLFVIVAVGLVGGVLFSFWARSNLTIIEGTGSTSRLMPTPDDPKQVNPIQPSGCVITGCSGQICANEQVASTCEWKEEYACYKTAVCERQSTGECGWTVTDELTACLESTAPGGAPLY